MTRMIERWFPCQEVSDHSTSGWGSGNSESNLFMWFAKRPLAQARAAVLTSLLPWPDDEREQRRLQALVKRAMEGYSAVHDEVVREVACAYPEGARLLDPFAGRGMIPLEAARYSVQADAIDYAPTAVLGSHLLVDFPLRDWSSEPGLPFESQTPALPASRLGGDAETVINEVGRRFSESMRAYFPAPEGVQPWGYMWAITLPCQECGNRFPLVGNLVLREPNTRKDDLGQAFYIEADRATGQWNVIVHDGEPKGQPTRRVATGKSRYDAFGKVAICPFCNHVHTKDVHTRLASQGLGEDALILAADLDERVGKHYREATAEEWGAPNRAAAALIQERPFSPVLSAVPDEEIPPGNTWTVQATVYGTRTYGEMGNARQTLGFLHLARHIADIGTELLTNGNSSDYARALAGYASAVMVRKLRRSTRGCTLDPRLNKVNDLFATESSLNFSYDHFEVGLGDGPGSWESVKEGTLSALRRQLQRPGGVAASVQSGSAIHLPFATGTFHAVVTDPPYDSMIDYTDASDLFYVWLKRSMSTTWPDFAVTSEPHGVQEKTEEIIVKKGGSSTNDPRNRAHYDRLIAAAFGEAARAVTSDGVVTIVFGHGEPEVWQRLLTAIHEAGLVLTGSWPAKTEKGGKVGFSNIVTTLTMACRPAPLGREDGRRAPIETEVRREVASRVTFWEKSGLAPTDMLMAAAGPAMEVVGRYKRILDARGEPVDISTFLPMARAAVQEAMAFEIDNHPLDTFDALTRFALWWVRLYGRQVVAKSELRWQALAASIAFEEVRRLVPDAQKGCRFIRAEDATVGIGPESPVIDVALRMASASEDGLEAVGAVLVAAARETDDTYLWSAMKFLAGRLPDSDPDAIAWTRILRNRAGVSSAAKAVGASEESADWKRRAEKAQMRLL